MWYILIIAYDFVFSKHCHLQSLLKINTVFFRTVLGLQKNGAESIDPAYTLLPKPQSLQFLLSTTFCISVAHCSWANIDA